MTSYITMYEKVSPPMKENKQETKKKTENFHIKINYIIYFTFNYQVLSKLDDFEIFMKQDAEQPVAPAMQCQ